ncbi:CDP-diacylglycerol--serine O-phosphatidyltransferase [Fulvivirga sp. M361]|nr:CDP-diacylglycerol--serine O-phosphatidyltransferase [Fulvivirga sp. M361]TRX61241.1 CDP-diacylglycerol--serine O-phosphatidyltransferase [Fulvivirga sp. M361]
MHIKQHIPNFLTCCNLLCGCVGLVWLYEGDVEVAVYLIWLALVFDFLDGFVARLLRVHSPMGKELDSLADLITFGVLPSFILYKMLQQQEVDAWVPYLAFLVAVFSAIRLAKFNIDENQQTVFIGLPTPANAIFISSLIFVDGSYPSLLSYPVLLIITILFSYLLVSPMELFALKFKDFGWKGNEVRFSFILFSALSLLFFLHLALPMIVMMYILLSFFVKIISTT